jgi:ribosome-associated translation inhibitor RaiA
MKLSINGESLDIPQVLQEEIEDSIIYAINKIEARVDLTRVVIKIEIDTSEIDFLLP